MNKVRTAPVSSGRLWWYAAGWLLLLVVARVYLAWALDLFGDEQSLRLHAARGETLEDPVVVHALVQGVLVDDGDAVHRLAHQIRVVELEDGVGARRAGPDRRRTRPGADTLD